MKFAIALAVLAFLALSDGLPRGVQLEPLPERAPTTLIRTARESEAAEKLEKDLEGSETAYAVYPYYYQPYLTHKYPYYVYGR